MESAWLKQTNKDANPMALAPKNVESPAVPGNSACEVGCLLPTAVVHTGSAVARDSKHPSSLHQVQWGAP